MVVVVGFVIIGSEKRSYYLVAVTSSTLACALLVDGGQRFVFVAVALVVVGVAAEEQ